MNVESSILTHARVRERFIYLEWRFKGDKIENFRLNLRPIDKGSFRHKSSSLVN